MSPTASCTIDSAAIRTELINTKTLDLKSLYVACQNQFPSFDKNAHYQLELIGHKGADSSDLVAPSSHFSFYTSLHNGVPVVSTSKGGVGGGLGLVDNTDFLVLYEDRFSAQAAGQLVDFFKSGSSSSSSSSSSGPVQCDFTGDPLVIQIAESSSEASGISMTAVLDGVLFDLLGAASPQAPYALLQSAWLSAVSRTTAFFVVKPNEQGQVKGIDELFGNNTTGPDGKFSNNGFEALRKYDGRLASGEMDAYLRDGMIDSRDPVFTRLRLWADRNGDGKAQGDELHRLSEFAITELDLNYDPNFKETDQFGNQIKLKSVVKTSAGKMHLMFDLWFRYF